MKKQLFMLVFGLMTMAAADAQTMRTQTIAHRGEWKSEGSAQNSRASLQRAMNLGIFGSEIDIWMTQDGHLMVNHDETFDGVTLQDATFATCKKLRLSNGERMPELKHLLKMLKKSKSPTRLIVEVKPHRDPMRSRACATATVELVRQQKLESRVMYISFSIEACETIHQLVPDAEVAYLNGDRTPAELHSMGITGIDYHFYRFREHPEWVEAAHRLGMNVNVWTVDNPDDIRAMQALGVDYITTNEPALCENIVRTN